ncbi:MAG: pitrilysin family protein [Candidatus Pacearchaeota archaeon]
MNQKFFRKVLKSGMTVVLEKRDSPAVSVAFAVRYGGINESSQEKGISHFIEHMLYKGTKKRNSRQIAIEIEKKGGVLNGFTDETVTAYWCKMPKNHVDVALDVLGDLVRNPVFKEEDMGKERNVIFEEIKMYKDSPSRHVFNEIHKSLFKEPFGIPLIGTEKTLISLNREKLVKKFKEVYRPENFILCAVGDIDFEKLVTFAEEKFSPDNFEGKSKKIIIPKIISKNEIKTEKRKGVDQANLIFAYHVPPSKSKKNFAARVLSVLMAGGMSSRLFHEIREKRNLAYAIKGGSDISKTFAYNQVYVGTKKENILQVKKILLEEFRKVSKDLDKKELDQVKEEILGNMKISMEDSQTQMAYLLHYEVEGNAEDFYKIEENIKAVKLEDVKKLAAEAAKNHSIFILQPA